MVKKRWTNTLGLAVMMVFVMAIVITSARKWTKTRAMVKETTHEVNYVTGLFAKSMAGDGEFVLSWAKGKVVDPWGNRYILDKNDPDGVRMHSRGPDGEDDTKDDIHSEVHVPPAPEPPEPPKKPSLMDKAKSLLPKKKEEPKEGKPSLWDRAKAWMSND